MSISFWVSSVALCVAAQCTVFAVTPKSERTAHYTLPIIPILAAPYRLHRDISGETERRSFCKDSTLQFPHQL